MNKEGTLGGAALLAIAAVVGVSLQTGSKQAEPSTEASAGPKRSKASVTKQGTHRERPGCHELADALKDFLATEELIPPKQCYELGDAPDRQPPKDHGEKTSQLKFVIAFLPDPVHTHASTLFDQFAVAIQEGAQDEKYDFDSSWLPWDDDESSYPLLADEKKSKLEQEFKETQPGIILFRKAPGCPEEEPCPSVSDLYSAGLIVFVVGEDATHGIHQDQFSNALDWIAALQPGAGSQGKRVAILGPTFSGSFPSVAKALSDPKIARQLDLGSGPRDPRLAIHSGSVSAKDLAQFFSNTFRDQLVFHSFVQDDDEILKRFCAFMNKEQPGFDISRVAILSEDETAYGGAIPKEETAKKTKANGAKSDCNGGDITAPPREPLEFYYPRDISSLRAAYQTTSLFNAGTSAESAQTQRRNLPTDLADPSGKVHDSIRSYGGKQTPLAQEAHLMEIVAALREFHVQYVLLRSSIILDQLFLANFLRRTYPDGRIVIFGSDLMLVRERGSTGLSGAMTLSTYPLFPLERDWTEHQSVPAPDRTFGSDTSEGTYVGFRLLLNDKTMSEGPPASSGCQVRDREENKIFLPSVICGPNNPIPDYSAPFWTLPDQCGEMTDWEAGTCPYTGPATWLSVIGVNRFWPLASLTNDPPDPPDAKPTTAGRLEHRKNDPGGLPEIPVGMQVFLLILAGFAIFHGWCCWFGSYTAKPGFRAHFASTGEWHQTVLVFGGSCCIAFSAIVAGWGSGIFAVPVPAGLLYPWFAVSCVTFAWLMAWGAILANVHTSWALSRNCGKETGSAVSPNKSNLPRLTRKKYVAWSCWASGLFVAATVLFCLLFVVPIQSQLFPENRVLTYWRATHLLSGVSPVVPILLILVGLYLSIWFTLHGLALFGPERPCLPPKDLLVLKDEQQGTRLLRMFSQEDAAEPIEQAATPWNWQSVAAALSLIVLFAAVAFALARGVPIRSLGSQRYALIFFLGLAICASLLIVETYRFCHAWEELRRLLAFLDRLPLRRTMAALRGFSWGSVWKMSGNVLEVRYKVMSRQLECMNHTITRLEEFRKTAYDPGAGTSLAALFDMRKACNEFAEWYSSNYKKPRAADLTSFSEFQKSVAAASGALLAQLLVPAWRREGVSLLTAAKDEKEGAPSNPPPQAKEAHIRNAEEFVCLSYLGFIQNVLGRLRTMAMTIIVLFLASAFAMSSYPFDPRQPLSVLLIALFVIGCVAIVKVYAEMHRDATLSHVTNTKPGELGTEFWFKIFAFGLAPLLGLLTRIFPGVSDFIFAWLQPSTAALK